MSNKIKPQAERKVSKKRKKEMMKAVRQVQKGTYKPPAPSGTEAPTDGVDKTYDEGWADCRQAVLKVTQDAYFDENVDRDTPLAAAILSITRAVAAATER